MFSLICGKQIQKINTSMIIYIYTALMRLFDWTRGKRERKKE
jgi:hypothetical protein